MKEEGKGRCRKTLLPLPSVVPLLEGQTQPQADRASIVNSLLSGADIVSAKVGIDVYVLNEELARAINVHIEIPDIREKRIEW